MGRTRESSRLNREGKSRTASLEQRIERAAIMLIQ